MFSERILWSFPLKCLLGLTQNPPRQAVKTFGAFVEILPWQSENKSNKVWASLWAFSALCDDYNTLFPRDTKSKSVWHHGLCLNRPFTFFLFCTVISICPTLWCAENCKLMTQLWIIIQLLCYKYIHLCEACVTCDLSFQFGFCFCCTIKHNSKFCGFETVSKKWETQDLHRNAIKGHLFLYQIIWKDQSWNAKLTKSAS